MTDQGCMLRAYSRPVIDAIVRSGAINTFIPALAYSFATHPAEVGVKHEERQAGVSNYSLYKLIRLNFDLITGFSLAPLELFTIFALCCAVGSFLLVVVLAWRRLILGPEEGGLFTLFGIVFFLLSVCMVGIGLIGEYVGRTYQVVRSHQRYHISRILEVHGMSRPRILFFGYSEVGHDCLALLLERGDNVVALVTHEDNPDEKIWFKTPAAAARERGLPVFTPDSVNTPDWVERIAQLAPDLILSVYYRHMISERILDLAPLGAFNMHGSLLPKYRGRAPINWAVLHGEPRIGMTLHRMVKRADAGAIVDQEGVEIDPRDTAEQAFRKVLPCARRGAGAPDRRPARRHGPGNSAGRKPGHLFRRSQRRRTAASTGRRPSRQIFNLVRAVTDPYPGAFTDVNGDRLMVWWSEPDSPATRDRRGRPGEILSLAPAGRRHRRRRGGTHPHGVARRRRAAPADRTGPLTPHLDSAPFATSIHSSSRPLRPNRSETCPSRSSFSAPTDSSAAHSSKPFSGRKIGRSSAWTSTTTSWGRAWEIRASSSSRAT